MKKIVKVLLVVLFLSATSISVFGQVPLSVCQITDNPIEDMLVISTGIVTDVPDNDKFDLTSEECTILCDGDINELPAVGDEVIVLSDS